MDSVFLEADEALKDAERRPTAQKGGAHAPPLRIKFNYFLWHISVAIHILFYKGHNYGVITNHRHKGDNNLYNP